VSSSPEFCGWLQVHWAMEVRLFGDMAWRGKRLVQPFFFVPTLALGF
jgi:hypothetical protein